MRGGKVRYDKEEMLRLLKKKADELGRFPKKREINADPRLPSSETYRTYYGNLPQLAVAIGLPACQGKKRRGYDHNELLTKIKELANRLGRMPTVNEVDEAPDLPCASTVVRYFGSLPTLAKKLGFQTKVKYSRFYTDDELLSLLKGIGEKLNKVPSSLDVKRDKNMPPFGVYKRRFGSYSNAVRLCGYEPRERRQRQEIPFDKFKEAMLNFYNEYKRVPSASEFMKVCKYYLVYIDGKRVHWNQLVHMCGLPIHTGTWSMKLHRKAELFIKSLLTRLGNRVVDKTINSARSPYDLLVNDSIRIQVSASVIRKKWRLEWHFNIPDEREFEYLIGIGYNERLEEEAFFVFPAADIAQSKVISIPIEGENKYSRFRIKDLERIGEYIR